MLDPVVVTQLSGGRVLKEWLGLEHTPANLMIDGGGADTGGGNVFPHGIVTWTPGAAFKFQPKARPKGQPWDNAYLYTTLTRERLDAIYFGYQFSFTYPTQADLAASTAFEIECELCENGLAYDMGWQCKASQVNGPPAWRWFDEGSKPKHWSTALGLPTPKPLPGAWTVAFALFSVNRIAKTTTHEGIVIDGTFYQVGATHHAEQKWSPQTNYFHAAVQQDSDGRGTPCTIGIRGWNVRVL